MTRHDNPFKNPETIDNTRDEIAAVFAENMKQGIAAKEIGRQGMKDIVGRVTKEARKTSHEETDSFKYIENDLIAHGFVFNHVHTEELFERAGFECVPSISEFERAGVDFALLAEEYDRMEKTGFEPQIVFAPHHGSIDIWKDTYRALVNDPNVPHDQLRIDRRYPNIHGLNVMVAPEEHWIEFDRVPDDTERWTFANGDDLPVVRVEDDRLHTDVYWTVRVVSAAQIGSRWTRSSETDDQHMTVAEYLTLQAVRAQQGQPLIDSGDGINTRLNGKLIGNSAFPSGKYSPNMCAITIAAFPDKQDLRVRKVVG